jgi:acyl-CoA-binding protein
MFKEFFQKAILNEMSRASDRTLGKDSDENLLWYVNNFISRAEKAGKKPTYSQLKKYLEAHDFTWDRVSTSLGLPSFASQARLNIAALKARFGEKMTDVTNTTNANKDAYDELIDLFDLFYEAKSGNDDERLEEITSNPKFQTLVDLFKYDTEKAQEVFGSHFDTAQRWLKPYTMDDYANSDEALIDEFWLYHRKKKAGDTTATLSNDKIMRLKEILADKDRAVALIGNEGMFYYMAKELSKLFVRNSGVGDDELDFDIGEDDGPKYRAESYRQNGIRAFMNEKTDEAFNTMMTRQFCTAIKQNLDEIYIASPVETRSANKIKLIRRGGGGAYQFEVKITNEGTITINDNSMAGGFMVTQKDGTKKFIPTGRKQFFETRKTGLSAIPEAITWLSENYDNFEKSNTAARLRSNGVNASAIARQQAGSSTSRNKGPKHVTDMMRRHGISDVSAFLRNGGNIKDLI